MQYKYRLNRYKIKKDREFFFITHEMSNIINNNLTNTLIDNPCFIKHINRIY